jgi:hypothetical protein
VFVRYAFGDADFEAAINPSRENEAAHRDALDDPGFRCVAAPAASVRLLL